jgi:hypothetical protein
VSGRPPTDPIENMRAVRKPGGITVWEGPRPVDPPLHLKPQEVADQKFWDQLGQSLATMHLDFTRVTGTVCHCGCLLRDETETCPQCVLWAEDDAAKASWLAATIHYTPTRKAA